MADALQIKTIQFSQVHAFMMHLFNVLKDCKEHSLT